jgi:hypothetical protein
MLTRRKFLGTAAAAAGTLAAASARGQQDPARERRIALLAGPPSHSYGSHEHPGGCRLLADRLGRIDGIAARVLLDWPKDDKALDDIDALIVFGDGGTHHPLHGNFDALAPLARRGVGLGFLHYALIVDGDQPPRQLLDWIGGVYELNWSVNPIWTADIQEIPTHPITRGVAPLSIEDEWYYHMRFRPEMQGVTPLLSALPPKSSLARPDGPHSGNPHVRRAVVERKEPQHLAWCTEREDGGRGFGFTGLHWHWNFAHDGFRRFLLNACAWLAGAEIPEGGIPSPRPTLDELIKTAGKPPAKWKPAAARERIERLTKS